VTHILSARAKVARIHEHKRCVSGKRDPLTGGATQEWINLGWFLHLDFGPESGPISFGVGRDLPQNITEGDDVILTIFKPSQAG